MQIQVKNDPLVSCYNFRPSIFLSEQASYFGLNGACSLKRMSCGFHEWMFVQERVQRARLMPQVELERIQQILWHQTVSLLSVSVNLTLAWLLQNLTVWKIFGEQNRFLISGLARSGSHLWESMEKSRLMGSACWLEEKLLSSQTQRRRWRPHQLWTLWTWTVWTLEQS